jgi:hypothetical protein
VLGRDCDDLQKGRIMTIELVNYTTIVDARSSFLLSLFLWSLCGRGMDASLTVWAQYDPRIGGHIYGRVM